MGDGMVGQVFKCRARLEPQDAYLPGWRSDGSIHLRGRSSDQRGRRLGAYFNLGA